MKRGLSLVLIFFIFFSSIQHSKAQYSPLLGDSSRWFISNSFEGCRPSIINAVSDTIINSINYKKVNYYYAASYHFNDPPELVGFIREDSLSRKIFYKQREFFKYHDTTEFLLYDFNLLKGDSIFLYNPNINRQSFASGVDTLEWFKVDSVSTITVSVGDRKAIYLQKVKKDQSSSLFPYFMTWVEGIGALNGPYIYREFEKSILNCFYKNDIHVYRGEEVTADSLCYCNINGISGNDLHNINFDLYPNPVLNNARLSYFPPPGSKNVFFQMVDLNGKTVLSFEIDRSKNTVNIDPKGLPNGMYFYNLRIDGKETARKKIVLFTN